MRLLQAALWQKGGYLTSRFSGRLDCADIVVETMQTGKPQIILPCYGDRIFAQTEDSEMAFSFCELGCSPSPMVTLMGNVRLSLSLMAQ